MGDSSVRRANLKDAVRWGKEEVVREILSTWSSSECTAVAFNEWRGSLNNTSSSQGDQENVLIIAADLGRVPIMVLLADYGADLNCFYDGITPLMKACQRNRIDMVDYLLSKGVEVTPRDQLNQTAIFYASLGGGATILKTLLDGKHGEFDVNAKNRYGMNSLMLAANNGHARCLEVLLNAGANIDERIYPELVGHSGVFTQNPYCTSMDGRTALHLAAFLNQVEAIKCLIAHGANRTIRDQGNSTPYMLASKECRREAFGNPIEGESGISGKCHIM